MKKLCNMNVRKSYPDYGEFTATPILCWLDLSPPFNFKMLTVLKTIFGIAELVSMSTSSRGTTTIYNIYTNLYHFVNIKMN